ncbi:restriction endonuclease [Actinoplanes sp. HUAS TT8]|uniref:restriction endonuclease n=1 Tax=Actinoplanes sp. HUAS TT8 TaxID=3447453 RepID=UPI003F51EE9A
MKINKSGSMRPPKLGDNDLGVAFGSVLGKLADETVHAIVFREVEIRVTQALRRHWTELDETVTFNMEINASDHLKMTDRGWESVQDEVAEYLRADRNQLENERVLARAHIALCDKVIAALSDPDVASAFSQSYGADGLRQGIALHYLDGSMAAARRMSKRMQASNQEYEDGSNRIVARWKSRNEFSRTPKSVALSQVDTESPESFEQLTAWLLKRDGCTIQRDRGGPGDQGADVIATTPDGLRIVLQCKHSTKQGNRLDPRHVHQLNGTARPIHGADIVGIVTNRALSASAEAFADSQGIHIVDRRVLKRWATYGVPWWKPEEIMVPTVVSVETPAEQEAA